MSEGQLINLHISKHEIKVSDDGQARTIVTGADKKKYTYFVSPDDGNWGKQLINDGTEVQVWLVDKQGIWNNKPIIYHNIYRPKDASTEPIKQQSPPPVMPSTTPEPPTEFFEDKPPEPAQVEHAPYTSDKDIKIRWMNAMNNATQIVAGLDLKKLGEQQIKNYIIEYANFFNTLEADMTMDTLPISKSQTIKLHEIAKSFGLNREDYHNVLKAIIGKTVAKTTDLNYNNAVDCIQGFDNVMKKGDIFNKQIREETTKIRNEVLNGALNDDMEFPF